MSDEFKKIEKHLKNYKNYKISIQNMKKQLDHMYPSITQTFDNKEGSSGTFTFKSDTENYAIKRVEKREEIEWLIKYYSIIVDSIDTAMNQLDPVQKKFVELKYFNRMSMKKVSINLKVSYRTIYTTKEEVKENFLITLKNLTALSTNPS